MSKKRTVYLALGSNTDNSIEQLRRARILLSIHAGVIDGLSPVYRTEPWGERDQPSFYNQCLSLSTDLPPQDLHQAILRIEEHMAKLKVGGKNGPRNIDIDILLYENEVISTQALEIPHPRMLLRNFVLIPLSALAPGAIHPIKKLRIDELLEQCQDDGSVQPLGVETWQ